MKDRIILLTIVVAGLSLILGLIGKLTHTTIFVANATWHNFAQTCLLFATAYGIGKLVSEKEK